MRRERAPNSAAADVAALREKSPLSAEMRSRADEVAAIEMERMAAAVLLSAIDDETGEPLQRALFRQKASSIDALEAGLGK